MSEYTDSPKTTDPMIFSVQTAHQTPTCKVAQRNFMNRMGTVQTLSIQSGEKGKIWVQTQQIVSRYNSGLHMSITFHF